MGSQEGDNESKSDQIRNKNKFTLASGEIVIIDVT